MNHPPLPLTQDLVLIGGGHTHALVLRSWAMKPLLGARLTLINTGPTAPYSGMLPGFVAGHYSRDELDIDLVKLAQAADARLIFGAATGIDLEKGEVHVTDHRPVAFDVASVDIGITSDMPALPGFAEHAVPAKPLGPFAERWEAYLQGDGPAKVAIIGGGVAGAELAMAMAHALSKRGRAAQIHLVDSAKALSALPNKSADALRAALIDLDIALDENADIAKISAQGLHLSDGRTIEADFVTGAAGARPYDWVSEIPFETKDGFITVNAQLQSSDPRVFAVGDCAHLAFDPRPKAGVYAVRQAPILADNLRAALSGGSMRSYRPQKDYLKLISMGGKRALGDRFGLTFKGPWVWRWKDRIDRKFMDQFDNLPAMPVPPLPTQRAKGMDDAIGPKPMCGGCGSKLGRDALGRALANLPPPNRDDVVPLPGDDAALLSTGQARQVFTTDHLRSFWTDAEVMARITAHHALGDVWAMGADPQAVVVSVTLPQMSEALAERSMQDILESVSEVVTDAGADIVGGHSTLGCEMTIGLSVTGLCEADRITLSGAKPGDVLVLTKPIGSGVLMAGHMAGASRGADVEKALAQMCKSQKEASRILRQHARAMTDVTGFGLAGHTQNICAASGVSTKLCLDDIPLMPGALKLSENGVFSSLYLSNRAGFESIGDTAQSRLFFDPQTSGGLLAALPAPEAKTMILALHKARYESAKIIGKIENGPPGQIEVV